MNTEGTLRSIIDDHLPFLYEAHTRAKTDRNSDQQYEPGILEANAAMVFVYASRILGIKTAESQGLDALDDLARIDVERIPPLAWNYIAYALLLVENELERRVSNRLTEGVRGNAELLLAYRFPTGLYRDTKAEETCWTAGPLVGAQALYPNDPQREEWQEKANEFFLNAYNREEDAKSDRIVEGKPLSSRVTTANLFTDFTCENHGAFHPSYQACINNYGLPYLVYRDYLGGVPESLVWNWEGIHSVMRRLTGANGRVFAPAGTDYFPYSHAEQIHYFALVADALDDDLAYHTLGSAARRLKQFQDSEHGRLVGSYLRNQSHIYWEFHFASFVAMAHAITCTGNKRRSSPDVGRDADANPDGRGPWSSPYTRFTIHKSSRFLAGFAVKGLLNRNPGSGYLVPSDGPIWSDHFCNERSLAPSISDHEGSPIALELDDHRIGHDSESSWVVASFMDEPETIRRTTAFVTHDEGALHFERITRYGEQVRIFGSDSDLSHSRAEGEEFSPWSVRTLNYRIVNDRLDFRTIAVDHEGGRIEFRDREQVVELTGRWIILDGRIGLVRVWGNTDWDLIYRRETKSLKPNHYWNHDTWSLTIALRGADPPARGYGELGTHGVLIVPVEGRDEFESSMSRDPISVVEKSTGELEVGVDYRRWSRKWHLGLGHLISIRKL